MVDVFTSRPLLGNPVAVVLDAEGLDTADIQGIARWTNLSETTFLLPPATTGADYRLRIFTPRSELPFAGRPTLGSAHAALEAGRVRPRDGKIVQECGVGLVELAVQGKGDDRRLAFNLPPATVTPLPPGDVDELEAVLGRAVVRAAAPAIVDVGAVWVVAQLASVADLLALEPDSPIRRLRAASRRDRAVGLRGARRRRCGHRGAFVRPVVRRERGSGVRQRQRQRDGVSARARIGGRRGRRLHRRAGSARRTRRAHRGRVRRRRKDHHRRVMHHVRRRDAALLMENPDVDNAHDPPRRPIARLLRK